MSDTPRDCEHGQLARACRVCELERELAAVTAERDATCRMLRASQEELERAMRVVEAAKAWSQDCDSDNRQGELWFAVMAWEAGR